MVNLVPGKEKLDIKLPHSEVDEGIGKNLQSIIAGVEIILRIRIA